MSPLTVQLTILFVFFYINLRIVVIIQQINVQNIQGFKIGTITNWILFLGVIAQGIGLFLLQPWYIVLPFIVICFFDPILMTFPRLYFLFKEKVTYWVMKNFSTVVVYFLLWAVGTISTVIDKFYKIF